MKKKCYPVLFYSGRLVARTPAFQVGEAGSKPVRSTKFICAWESLVNLLALEVRNRRFKSYRTDQFNVAVV